MEERAAHVTFLTTDDSVSRVETWAWAGKEFKMFAISTEIHKGHKAIHTKSKSWQTSR